MTCDFQKLLMQCFIFGSICVECRLRGLTMRAAQLVHNLMKLQAPKANSVQTRLFSVQLELYLSKVATQMVAPPAQFDECFAISLCFKFSALRILMWLKQALEASIKRARVRRIVR